MPARRRTTIHVTRQWTEREAKSTSKGDLKLDFRNAFNRVNRDAMLQDVEKSFPSLARWARWCYEQPSHLCFNGHLQRSATVLRSQWSVCILGCQSLSWHPRRRTGSSMLSELDMISAEFRGHEFSIFTRRQQLERSHPVGGEARPDGEVGH